MAFDVLPNGEVVVGEQDVVAVEGGSGGGDGGDAGSGQHVAGDDGGQRAMRAAQRIGRALDVCGELGVWVEWMRRTAAAGGR